MAFLGDKGETVQIGGQIYHNIAIENITSEHVATHFENWAKLMLDQNGHSFNNLSAAHKRRLIGMIDDKESAGEIKEFVLDSGRADNIPEEHQADIKNEYQKVLDELEAGELLKEKRSSGKDKTKTDPVEPIPEPEERENTVSEKTMTQRAIDTVKDDLGEVAYRVSASQLTKMVQEPIVMALMQGMNLQDNESTRKKIGEFLKTDLGKAAVALFLSLGVQAAPLPQAQKAIAKKLSKELRIQAETNAGEVVGDMVTMPFKMLLANKLENLPIFQDAQAPKTRVAAPPVVAPTIEEDEEEEATAPPAKMTAGR